MVYNMMTFHLYALQFMLLWAKESSSEIKPILAYYTTTFNNNIRYVYDLVVILLYYSLRQVENSGCWSLAFKSR